MVWNKKIYYSITLILLSVCVLSCSVSYKLNGASINYDKVKTISIAHFAIKGGNFYAPLATTFNEDLKDIFVRQTHLRMVKRNADLQIEGEITGYNVYNQAVSASGYSSEMKLTVTVNVRFVNNTNHSEDFERSFSAYRVTSKSLTSVQDDLIAEMNKDITEEIFNATVANW